MMHTKFLCLFAVALNLTGCFTMNLVATREHSPNTSIREWSRFVLVDSDLYLEFHGKEGTIKDTHVLAGRNPIDLLRLTELLGRWREDTFFGYPYSRMSTSGQPISNRSAYLITIMVGVLNHSRLGRAAYLEG